MGLDYFLMAWAPVLSLLFIARIVSGIAGATYATAAAVLSDISERGERSAQFGLIGGAFGMGFVLGPAIGGILGELGTRVPFVAAGIIALANAAFGYFVLHETLDTMHRRRFQWSRCNPLVALMRIRRFPSISMLMLVTFLLATANNVYVVIWSFFTIEKFAWSISLVGWSLACYGLCAALAQAVFLQWFIKRTSVHWAIIIGFVISILTFVWLAFINSTVLIFLGIPISALGAIAGPALQGLMADQVGDSEQGELQGIFASVIALSMIVSPLVMGFVFKFFSNQSSTYYFPGAPFLIAGALMTTAMILFLTKFRAESRQA